MKLAKNIVLYIIFFVCVVLLFVAAPDTGSSRSATRIWGLGHIMLFTLGTYLLIRDNKFLARQSFVRLLAIIFFLSFIFGSASEYFQVKFNRTPDIDDLGRDIIGSLFAVAFFSASRKKTRTILRLGVQTMMLGLMIYQFVPFAQAFTDEVIAWFQFPVLADFETPFEQDRWSVQSRIEKSQDVAYHGHSSLLVRLNTDRYSGVFLQYFPGNWKDYQTFLASFYNPDSVSFEINCRIEDRWHKNFNGTFSDRFYHRFHLHPGWNTIRIPLDSLINAPKYRRMDIQNIRMIGFYASRLPQPKVIYIDDIRLN